ncbi:TetR/AcrR family transcriptional regulator [Mangrovimicrobium sediminis]|uniref:TetR/AcrR family transcriptional regulator n=1 Tax=Mangrovimicrobium sediminis TaxID=2562682 RepID=UPI0014369B78|nr:TetR/AcrR family transcriptional regulator [Haliea sp. SAOS-164]
MSGRSRGRPRLEEVAGIENRLLKIALKEFLDQGYGGTSMTRIVQLAGVSKTTLYSRFPSKEKLFQAIMYQQIKRIAPDRDLEAFEGAPDLEAGLKAYANRVLQLGLRGDLLGINRLIYSESHRFPELGAAAAKRTQVGVGRIAKFIEECAEARGETCVDARGAAETYILTLRGWYVDAMLTNQKVPAAERQRWVDRAVRTLISSAAQW